MELIESLDQLSSKLPAVRDVAESHATQRIALEDYTLEQVQAEYMILRQAVFEVLEDHATISAQERDIILDVIVEGRVAAAEEYMRLAESQIHWGKEQLALALDSAEMGSFDLDIQHGKLGWSATMIRLHGFHSDQFTGTLESFWPCVHPEDRRPLEEAMQKSLREKHDYQADYRVIWPDGSIHWIATRGRPYFDRRGKPIRILGTGFEITERKKTEEQLKEAHEATKNEQAWFEMILDRLPTPITLINSDGTLLFANQASKNLRADIPKAISLERFADNYALDRLGNRIPPEEMPRFRVIRGEQVRDFELTWNTPKGSMPLLINGTFLPGAFGHPAVGLLTFHDITALKQIEAELRKSESKFRILFESNLIGVVFGDVSGGMYEMNDYFLNLIGYSREEIQQGELTWVQLTPAEYLHLDEQASREMSEKGYCSPYEKPFIRKDGNWVWVMLTAIFTDETRFNHLAIIVDMTDHKRIREALQESERQLRLVMESVPQIIWIALPDATIEQYNQNWIHYTGFLPETLQGRPWEMVLHPDDFERTLEAWKEAQVSGKYVVEHRVRRYDGIYRWYLSRARPLHDESGKIVKWFGTSTDIEEQKHIQQALEQERDLREQFVSTLSHDLRNPLSAAKISSQIIARYPDRTDRIPALANRISDSLERADKMISDLLDANRIRAGKGIPIEIDQCDLAEIADRVCEDLSTIHGDRFKREFQHPIEGYWSCRNIQRLLENLLTNGLKYGYATTPVTLRILERGESIEIAVHNYGDPIPPDERKRLFDPFIRSKAVESGEKKGWGLGLTLVRGVTEAHHGRVEVESSREAGTTFLVILPRDARKA